jgi:hypothetical protein
MEKSTKKKLIIIGSLLVIGGVVAYIVIKKPFSKGKDGDATDSPPAGEGSISESTLPAGDTTTPPDVKAQSFNDVKKFFGNKAKVYADYMTYSTSQESMGISVGLPGTKLEAKFLSNGGYRLYMIPKGSSTRTLLNGGLYYNGGKKLRVVNSIKSSNKGLNVTGDNVTNNLKKTLI